MITILKGGISSERQVSLWTAQSVAESLASQNIPFHEVDAADASWLEQIQQAKSDCVIIALHGPFGEDGTVQKQLEELGIRYTGSSSAVSAITIQKAATKRALHNIGVAMALDQVFRKGESVYWNGEYPVVVKPNGDGSSFGVTIVQNEADLQEAAEKAFVLGDVILLEEFIEGKECTCGVIMHEGSLLSLPLVEIRPREAFFNFDAKYDAAKCDEICPAEIDEKLTEIIQKQSKEIFIALSCSQYARIDWILKGETPYFLEINTLPGMTKTSLIIKELAAAEISYDTFIQGLIH